jgi:tRNA uridine 5-carboxymethylaminomethyl modification enzyme
MPSWDVIVVGLGHAGCEAALACARTGLSTLAVTLKADRSAVMSCNPAIGGTAKGHLVRELDALGGEMARNADRAGTHFLTLNASKGPAVRATRVLCDRDAYATAMQQALATQLGLTVVEGEVESLTTTAGRRVSGVLLKGGDEHQSRAVIITTGTFLQALMHLGSQQEVGGRLGDAAATGLSPSLRSLGFTLGRFKTGTPPRLLAASIDYARCQPQPGDEQPRPFSARTATPFPTQPQLHCHVTHTTAATHQAVKERLDQSPLYQGIIVGRGPRYCPSLEDKVVRFAHKSRHTIFLEPEGPASPLVYPAGLSTSLPAEAQLRFLRTIPGLEAVEVARYGYAVEYDFAPPTQLHPTLETRRVEGLYFAGQLNGTSGYEEAAVQGLMAGINASLKLRGLPAMVLGRHEAHLAVLLDELVTKGVDEPFRMLTSRSEHRLRLREGNAQRRLRPHGHRAGLVTDAELEATRIAEAVVQAEVARLEREGLSTRLRQPGTRYADLAKDGLGKVPDTFHEEVETEVKYAPYLAQHDAHWLRRTEEWEGWAIPDGLDFGAVRGLSAEAQDRLKKARPATLKAAGAISGVTPAAVGLLAIHLKRLSGSA